MIAKCANPACSTPFRYLHEGRLFRFERGVSEKGQPFLSFDATGPERSNRVEFFWLCDQCSTRMTLTYRKGIGVTPSRVPSGLKAAS
jgi:hypothetical protein